jgi:hypothetical protein
MQETSHKETAEVVGVQFSPRSVCSRFQSHPVARLDFGWRGREASILVPLPGFE